jgi:diguanylate cyclase (GGDEF)-like protein
MTSTPTTDIDIDTDIDTDIDIDIDIDTEIEIDTAPRRETRRRSASAARHVTVESLTTRALTTRALTTRPTATVPLATVPLTTVPLTSRPATSCPATVRPVTDSVPSPTNEAERLAALHRAAILDTPAEEVYDEIVHAAAELCGAPISLVSLIDEDRQWFKAKTGIDAEDTPRDLAFCAHAICSDELMEVPDARTDQRFASNPLVLDAPNVRFYAGVPLRASAGYSYGTLCVIDTVPRTLTDEQREGLSRLARQVTVLLELRESVNQLNETCRELEEAHRERDEVEARLRHQAHHDALTGLPNRALLTERVEAAFAPGATSRHPLAMMVCDVDNFKVVNDGLGHPAGDRLIVEIGHRLRSCVRTSDTVARFGGDEFVILVENTDHDSVARLAVRLLEAVSRPLAIGTRADFRPAISLGLAFRTPGIDGDQLLSNADAAMYQAKSMGGGRLCVFDDALQADVVDQLMHATDLQTATTNDELFCVYQPEIDLATGDLFGLEALVRWEHPVRGTLPPHLFVPALESSNRIGELFDRVLDLALAAQARWVHELGRRPNVAVNLSARQLDDECLAGRIHDALRRFSTPPSSLCLEVTESGLPATPSFDVLHDLQRSGVQLAIDDFGVGSSSMARLSMFPWDLLKIDRAFIEPLGQTDAAHLVVRGIVSLAHDLGMRTVAEGVETVQQLDLLREVGCDVVQGYLLDRPMPLDEMSHRLSRRAGDLGATGIAWRVARPESVARTMVQEACRS